MDGFKRKLSASIQFRLSFWLSLAILCIAIIAGIFSFASAFDEAQELQDGTLRQIAALFDHQVFPLSHPLGRIEKTRVEEASRMVVQYLSAGPAGRFGESSSATVAFPASLPDGLQTVRYGHEYYRVLVKTLPSHERIAVAQETGIRDATARDSALRTVAPFVVLFPLLLYITADLTRKMLRPVLKMSAEIDRRTEQDLRPVEGQVPREIAPFVVAINRLLKKVEQAMEDQRRFVADAAHELRTPMAALALQAELLSTTSLPEEAQERVRTLRRGIARAKNLLDQLLCLARQQSLVQEAPDAMRSVQAVCRRVLEDIVPLAEAKQIDIGMTSTLDIEVEAREMDLFTLIKNLVDNAVRYTPPGGRVDIAIRADGMGRYLVIEDTGPGIPQAERDRVFAPFYRILDQDEIGSGLGLSIAQTIVHRMGARIELGETDPASKAGLRVTVTWPDV